MAAFEQLVSRYERSVRSVAWAFLHDSHACEDATQDVFVAAFSGLATLTDGGKFGPWLMQIARRTCQKLASQSSRKPTSALIDEVATEPAIATLPRQRQLLGLIERLPDNERLVVTMHYFDGHSSQEIANITGRPVGTVTKQLSRACQRLRGWAERIEENAQ